MADRLHFHCAEGAMAWQFHAHCQNSLYRTHLTHVNVAFVQGKAKKYEDSPQTHPCRNRHFQKWEQTRVRETAIIIIIVPVLWFHTVLGLCKQVVKVRHNRLLLG